MNRIILEPSNSGGKPLIRGLRITVFDVLAMLSESMTQHEILEDFSELELADTLSILSFAADPENRIYSLAVQ